MIIYCLRMHHQNILWLIDIKINSQDWIGLSLSYEFMKMNIGLLKIFIDIICVWRLSKEWWISLISADWLIKLYLLNYNFCLLFSAQKVNLLLSRATSVIWNFTFCTVFLIFRLYNDNTYSAIILAVRQTLNPYCNITLSSSDSTFM